jgi:uncharacterized protein
MTGRETDQPATPPAAPPMTAPTDRRRLRAFLLIAFTWTWLLWLPALWRSVASGAPLPTIDGGVDAWRALTGTDRTLAALFQLAVYGPAVAALAVLLRSGDRGALATWARSIVRLRVPWRWYAFVALAPVALGVAVVALGAATGGGVPVWPATPALSTVFLLFATQTLTSGLEEPGWRGFALPLLQRSMTAERANWWLGLVWAAWHLPYVLYLYRDMPVWALPLTLAGFAMSIVAMGYVHAWVFNSTGSVALNVLLHGWANVTNAVAVTVMASPLVPLATAGVTWLFVGWLLRRYGGQALCAGPAERPAVAR